MSGFSFPPSGGDRVQDGTKPPSERNGGTATTLCDSASVSLEAVPPFVAQTRKLFFGRPLQQ